MQNMIDAIEQEIQFANVSRARPRSYRAGYTRALEFVSGLLNVQYGNQPFCACEISNSQRILLSVSPDQNARSRWRRSVTTEHRPESAHIGATHACAGRRVRQHQHSAKSRPQSIQGCTRKQREIAASSTRRAAPREFPALRNLFVSLPHMPAKVDAEPEKPVRLNGRTYDEMAERTVAPMPSRTDQPQKAANRSRIVTVRGGILALSGLPVLTRLIEEAR